jgi:hypothetical protein
MGKQNTNKNNLKLRLDKTGQDAQNGIKWFLAAIDQEIADVESLLNLSRNLSGRLAMFESILEEFQAQLEKEQLGI